MDVVFPLQPLGGGGGLLFQIVAARRRLAASPLGEIGVVALAPACIAAASMARMKRSDNSRLADDRPALTTTWLGMSRQ